MQPQIAFSITLLMLATAGLAFSEPSLQSRATFDCTKASGEIEKLICKDEGLASLDRQMAEVYAKAMKSWPSDVAKEQRGYQRGWIKGRNDCWKETIPVPAPT